MKKKVIRLMVVLLVISMFSMTGCVHTSVTTTDETTSSVDFSELLNNGLKKSNEFNVTDLKMDNSNFSDENKGFTTKKQLGFIQFKVENIKKLKDTYGKVEFGPSVQVHKNEADAGTVGCSSKDLEFKSKTTNSFNPLYKKLFSSALNITQDKTVDNKAGWNVNTKFNNKPVKVAYLKYGLIYENLQYDVYVSTFGGKWKKLGVSKSQIPYGMKFKTTYEYWS
ncbi:MAG: hypothetical protein LBM02_10450 [Lachnospiraceae bacterium]|jgi:hypothetical protein|nr:hypothetical protein [Lachnospiraceae bacterium]